MNETIATKLVELGESIKGLAVGGGGIDNVMHTVLKPEINTKVISFPVSYANANKFVALVIKSDVLYDADVEQYSILVDYAGVRDMYASQGRYHVIKATGAKDYYNLGMTYTDDGITINFANGFLGAGHTYDIYVIT